LIEYVERLVTAVPDVMTNVTPEYADVVIDDGVAPAEDEP